MTMLNPDRGSRMSPTWDGLSCALCSIHWLLPYLDA